MPISNKWIILELEQFKGSHLDSLNKKFLQRTVLINPLTFTCVKTDIYRFCSKGYLVQKGSIIQCKNFDPTLEAIVFYDSPPNTFIGIYTP